MTAIRRSDEDKTANADMLTMAVIGVFYPFALLLGSSLKFGADNIPLILPASGVLLGLFLCCHYSRWPYLILFTGLSQFITDQILPVDSSAEFITTLGASLIESIGVALLIRWSLKSFLDIEKAAHILEYFLLTAVFSTAVASFLRTDLHNLIFASPSYWQFWLNNWMPALTGIVVITPVLLAWIRQRSSDPSPVTQARRLECATLFLTTIIASAGISSVASSSFVQAPNYSFLVLGTLVWASLRMRPVVALLNMLMSAFIIILNSSQGNGPYALNSFEPQNLDLQLYLCSAALITLLTSTLLSRLRRNEAELSISSEARRTAMEAIHQCSWHYDKDLNLVAWDSGVGGDYSLSGNEKIGYPLLDDLEYWARQGSHGEGNAKEIARRRLQQYRDGTIPSYETRANNKRGTLEIRRYRMPDGGYTETQNDITEQLKAEEMARKNEPLFKAFLSNTPGLITIKNLDGCYSHMSDEFYDLFNLTPDRVIGHYPDEIFKPDLAKLIEEGDLAIINSGIAWQKEIYIETPKGRKDFYTVQFPVIDNSGKMLAIGGIATDISQFKQQQRSLQNSEQEYRELVEGSIQGIYIYDANQMLFVNQACAEIFGYASPAEVIALETRFQLYANYEYERLASYAERRLRGENPPASYEFDGVRKDGSIIRLSTLVRRVHWKGNDALQTVVVDVTREKRAAENMRHSEIRYRSLFDLAPIALQEQDWSRAKSLIDRLTAEGVEDIRSYLNKNPRLIYKLGDVLEIRGINQTALQMFQAPDKATYTNWIHNVPCAPFREEILDRLDNLSQGIRHYNNESTSVRMNGDTFPVLITSTLVSDDADDWSQIYISIIDLTSLNEALAQQRESELRYRRLFNLAPIALYVQDFSKGRKILDDLRKQGIDDIQSHLEHNPGLLSSNNSVSSFLNANQEVLRLYQFADMNLFKTWLSNDFSPEGHSRMVERLLRFNSGERKVSVETTATRFNGERFPILQTIEIVGDDESDWSRVYTTIQDLTERHKAEVELRDSEQKFRNLAEGSLQGIAVFDLNWDIKFVNQALAKMLGFAKTEALFAQQNWANFIVDYEIPRMLDYQQKRLLGDNPPSQYELDLVKANGDVFTCLMGVRLIEWNNSSAFQCLIFDISDHKQAELALTESEARFRAFMNNTPDPIIISDIQGRYLFANRQFENLYRVSSDQLMGQLPSDLVDEDDSKLIMVEEQRVRETREVRNYHQTSYLNDEEMLWSVTRFPILDESGNLTATGEISRDITQQRRIELALQQSEQSYRRLFDHAPIALYQQNWSKCKSLLNNLRQLGVVDLRKHLHENPDLFRYSKDIGQIINVNREAVSMHRSTDKKMQIEWQSNHLPEQVRDSLIERLLLLEAGNRRASSEGIGIRIDGEEFPKLSTTVILGDDLEDWSLIYTAEIDLTELKEAERALQESEHRYRQLFETAPVALWEQDWSRLKSLLDDLRAKGVTDIPEHLEAHPEILEDREKFIRIIDVNSETLRLYGASDTNQLRRSIFAPSWQQQNLGLLERIDSFLKGNIRVVIESEGVRINGSRFPVRVTTEIVGGDSEDWSEVYSTHQDITEEVLAAERLGAYRDELRSLAGKMSLAEESERRKISSALHDGTIQNLVLARMQVSALSKSLNTRKSQDSLESINQLLESSIKETRTMIFEISPPVLYELGLKAAIEWLTDQFKRRTGIDVLLVVDDKNAKLSEELKIVIFQAMREFLVNITKHAEADKITIRWTSLRDHLEIEIEDNGVGFDITDVGTKSSEEGGFGLFSLRERLSLLGAEFSITSSCKGTRVTLVAPLLTSDDYTALN